MIQKYIKLKVSKDHVYGAITAFIVINALSFFIIPLLPPYKEVRRFIEQSSSLREEIGNVQQISRSLWAPFYYSNNSVHAEVNVIGEKSSGIGYLDLVRGQDGWKVSSAKIITKDNRELQLLNDVSTVEPR